MSTDYLISDVRRELTESKKKVSEFLKFKRAAQRDGLSGESAEEIRRRAFEAVDYLFDDETGADENENTSSKKS